MQEAPEINLGLELYMTAFRELNSCRSLGFGEGPIPWSAISDWCKAYDLDEETKPEVFFFVRELDNEYLKFLSEKRTKETKSKGD